jgi:four helix bundle protein
MPMQHERLVVWPRADDLFIHIHLMTRKQFPPDERFELRRQIRRAAYSIVANIVEGVAREHRAERLQFFNIAWGSLAETGYCLHAAKRLGYIDEGSPRVLIWKFDALARP